LGRSPSYSKSIVDSHPRPSRKSAGIWATDATETLANALMGARAGICSKNARVTLAV